MVEIVKQLGWTYVSTLAAQGEYGEKVSQILPWSFRWSYICLPGCYHGHINGHMLPLSHQNVKIKPLILGNLIVYSVGKKVWSLYRRIRDYQQEC